MKNSRTAPSEIITGVVKRVEFGHVVVDLGRAEGVIRRDQQIPREMVRVGDRIRSLIMSVAPRSPRPADLPLPRPSRLHEEAVRAGSARDLRRHHRDQGRRPRSGQPRQDRRHQPRQLDRPGRRLRRHEGQPRPGGRPGAAGREDRHHPVVARTSRPSSSTRSSRRPSAASSSTRKRAASKSSSPTTSSASPSAAAARTSASPASSPASQIDILTEADASEKRQREFVERSEMFQNELDVDETLSQLLVAEGFTSLEEVAYVEVDEIASIEGLDEDLAAELQSRADRSARAPRSRVARRAPQARRRGCARRAAAPHRSRCWSRSARPNIKTLDDLADLATDELIQKKRRRAAPPRAEQPARGQGRHSRRIRPQRRAGQRDHHGRPRALVRGRRRRPKPRRPPMRNPRNDDLALAEKEHVPERTCILTRRKGTKDELIRLALGAGRRGRARRPRPRAGPRRLDRRRPRRARRGQRQGQAEGRARSARSRPTTSHVPADLGERIEAALRQAALDRLGHGSARRQPHQRLRQDRDRRARRQGPSAAPRRRRRRGRPPQARPGLAGRRRRGGARG